jgi:hypothetical protein
MARLIQTERLIIYIKPKNVEVGVARLNIFGINYRQIDEDRLNDIRQRKPESESP